MTYSSRSCGNAGRSPHVSFVKHPLALAIAAAFVTSCGSAWAQLPTGAAIVNGTAAIVTNGSRMTITNSPNAVINWKGFSIGAQNGVRFEQQNAASQVLNRVVGNDPSSILGSLSSNGGVWLVNPHGILFGPNARVDVGGLVASTLGITNDDFLSGRFKFDATTPLGGQVLNQGEINTTFGGRVWLMGDAVRNEGLIRTPGGNIVLAAGKSIELIDSGMPNVTVRLTAPENEALNLGSLIATASGSIDVHGGIVNQQGIVRADSLGTDAAGRVLIKAQGDVKLGDTSITSASTTGTGAAGRLMVESTTGTTSVTGRAVATSTEGLGGQVHLLGKNVGVFKQAEVDVSGATGGGEVLVGGDYQGKNAAVLNAGATYLGPDASLKASATQAGDGGKVIVWGDNAARVYGSIEAKGGASGNGGFVETSGGYLDAQPKRIDVGSPGGKAGTWLLDPYDITIAGEDNGLQQFAVGGDAANYTVASTQDSSVIAAWRINQQLGFGTNVEVSTGTSPTSTQAGNIVVAANIFPEVFSTCSDCVSFLSDSFVTAAVLITPQAVPPGSLTLRAHNDIIINPGVRIESTVGPMPVTLIADSDNTNQGGVNMQRSSIGGATVSTDGGNIRMSGRGLNGILIDGGTLNAGTGTIVLTGVGTAGGSAVTINGADLTSLARGDAITMVADRFVNVGSTLSTSNGRWLVYSGPGQTSSFTADLGGLDYGFVQFSAPFATTPALSDQNGVLLADPLNVQVKVNATRPYDGTVQATFDSLLSHNAPTGIDVQTLSSDGRVAGTFQDKNVGVDKPITSSAEKFLLRTSSDKPVFGGSLSLVGDIIPLSFTASGITAANKVYDDTRTATLVGSASGMIAGDAVALTGITGLFDDQNVGTGKTVTISGGALTGADARNYSLTGIATTTADITPKPVGISITGLVSKEYDATTAATLAPGQFALNGMVGNDVLSVTGPTLGIYDTPNVGTGKQVTATGAFSVNGNDAPNYSVGAIKLTAAANTVSSAATGNVGTITPATLTFSADPAVRELGLPVTGLTGSLTGFKGADNTATATSGTLAWLTDASAISPPGIYAINGAGLSAGNYTFTQAAANATALALIPINRPEAPQQQASQGSTSAINVASRSAISSMSHRGLGFGGVFDVSSPLAQACFGPVNVATMNPEELAKVLDCRKDFKRKLFAEAIYKLEIDPSLADVPPCTTAAEAATGRCHITTTQLEEIHASPTRAETAQKAPKSASAALPQIERKIAVMFGVNDYADTKIPRLENAVPDVEAVSKIFAEKLGYEVRVVRNAKKDEIIRALNELSAQINPSDSVVVYYAGHGLSLEKNGAGYWIPSDAPANDPSRWISNSDIAKLLAGNRSRQMAVISDSCYSGAFAREGMTSVGRDVTPEEVLTKRSVVVLSSGGDEPVSDEGKEGHSIFAWNLMKAMNSVQNWRPGSTIFNEVQLSVKKEFPQTPRYGSVTSAGHQQGGDYLFEQR
jgi:filamentous hemagglutinin family protein